MERGQEWRFDEMAHCHAGFGRWAVVIMNDVELAGVAQGVRNMNKAILERMFREPRLAQAHGRAGKQPGRSCRIAGSGQRYGMAAAYATIIFLILVAWTLLANRIGRGAKEEAS